MKKMRRAEGLSHRQWNIAKKKQTFENEKPEEGPPPKKNEKLNENDEEVSKKQIGTKWKNKLKEKMLKTRKPNQ